MNRYNKTIIYSDLDGTFLDEENYSFQEALPALRAAREKGFRVVFCSSKTRAEIEHIRKATAVNDPFIVESGGAIFIPEGYFPFGVEGGTRRSGYEVIEMGGPYWGLVELIRSLRSTSHKLSIVGFSDLTAGQLALECNLTHDEANRAKDRAYSEPFRFCNATAEERHEFLRKIRRSGLEYSNGGRYYHVHDAFDKGRAVGALNTLYRRAFGSITTVGLGDSLNDAAMLSSVERPIIVKKACGIHLPDLAGQFPHAQLTRGSGPRGWAEAVLQLVNE
jgi:mannosyl-3-phosphoglycerate phosphatase